ncbi:hypothetical protein NEIPOLOT_00054 [Neisseria polysaccharea ATCC 43768]|nr:hypothetical protein NEIPOLOT_00054 [Neisseria polysaccharea ATCC 43768]
MKIILVNYKQIWFLFVWNMFKVRLIKFTFMQLLNLVLVVLDVFSLLKENLYNDILLIKKFQKSILTIKFKY